MLELSTSQRPLSVTAAVRTRRASTGCRFALSLLLVSSVLGPATPLVAQPASTSARAYLSVDGTDRCATVQAVQEQVQARSRRIAFVLDAADVPKLQISVRREPGGAHAVALAVTWPDGRRSQRRFVAHSCQEAEATAAFLIALTLDPTAFGEPSAAGDPASSADTAEQVIDGSASPPAPATKDAAPLSPSASMPGGNRSGVPASDANESKLAPFQPSRERPPGPAADGGANLDLRGFFAIEKTGVSLTAHVTSGVAPVAMYGLGLSTLMAFRGRGLWAPALQLEAAHVWVSGLTQPGGVAAFQRTTARLDVCMLGLRAAGLAAHACLNGALGSLGAQGSQSYLPQARERLWADLGGSLLLCADIGRLLQFELGATLAVPLRRDRFAFHPDVFHRVAALCWDGHLGMGVRFP
jgi:hypothetical protein